jgi:hypothetical protein
MERLALTCGYMLARSREFGYVGRLVRVLFWHF